MYFLHKHFVCPASAEFWMQDLRKLPEETFPGCFEICVTLRHNLRPELAPKCSHNRAGNTSVNSGTLWLKLGSGSYLDPDHRQKKQNRADQIHPGVFFLPPRRGFSPGSGDSVPISWSRLKMGPLSNSPQRHDSLPVSKIRAMSPRRRWKHLSVMRPKDWAEIKN